LPSLSSGSPAGYNEGIVAGFTRGLQDGYYAGFQAWQTTGPAPRVGNVYPTARTLSTANSLPRALPHVSQTGGLPIELQDAQLAAFQAYESNFQRPAFDQERLAQINQGSQYPNGPNYPSQEAPQRDTPHSVDSQKQAKEDSVHEEPLLESDSQQRKTSEDDLIGELRSRQSSLERQEKTQETEEVSFEEEDEILVVSRTDEEEIRIAGMSLMVAVLVFSGAFFPCKFRKHHLCSCAIRLHSFLLFGSWMFHFKKKIQSNKNSKSTSMLSLTCLFFRSKKRFKSCHR